MGNIIWAVHILTCCALITIIILQPSKGGDLNSSISASASHSLFGSKGSAGFITKATAALAIIFFVTSLLQSYFIHNISNKKHTSSITHSQDSLPSMPGVADTSKK